MQAIVWEQDRFICMRRMVNEWGSTAQRAVRAQQRPPVQITRHSCFPLFCSIVSKCEKLLSSPPHTKPFIGLYWCMVPAALLKLPALKEFAWWCLAAQLCPQVDLWAVKDGQINTPSIPDRTTGSETSWYLGTSLMQHTVCLPGPSRWGLERASWRRPHTPFSQLTAQRVARRFQMMLLGT